MKQYLSRLSPRAVSPVAWDLSTLLILLSFLFVCPVAFASPEEAPSRPTFSEDGPPPVSGEVTDSFEDKEDETTVGGWTLDFNGYARLPLMISGGITGDRRPYLIDDQYFNSGFAYTRVSEREWVELFVSASKGNTRIVAGLFTSELSDWAQDALPKGQKGIATAFLDHRWEPMSKLTIDARVGVFWERLGYIEAYDTYLIGRTHIGGGRLSIKAWDHAYLRVGYGAHKGDPTNRRGFTPMHWAVAGAQWRWLDVAAYYVHTSTADDEYVGELQEVLSREEAFVKVWGGDVYARIPYVGQLALGVAYVDAENADFLGDAHELLHTSGGGPTFGLSRYLGKPATGEILATHFEFAWRLRESLRPFGDRIAGIIGLSELKVFGMSAHVVTDNQNTNPTENYHDRMWLKWGSEFTYRPLSIAPGWFAGFRFDRVILDSDYDSLSFRVISPRVGFSPIPNFDIFASYAFYEYGDNIKLQSDGLFADNPNTYVGKDGPPDETVFKLQAQARW